MENKLGGDKSLKQWNQKSTNIPFNWTGKDNGSQNSVKIKSYYQPSKR